MGAFIYFKVDIFQFNVVLCSATLSPRNDVDTTLQQQIYSEGNTWIRLEKDYGLGLIQIK